MLCIVLHGAQYSLSVYVQLHTVHSNSNNNNSNNIQTTSAFDGLAQARPNVVWLAASPTSCQPTIIARGRESSVLSPNEKNIRASLLTKGGGYPGGRPPSFNALCV